MKGQQTLEHTAGFVQRSNKAFNVLFCIIQSQRYPQGTR